MFLLGGFFGLTTQFRFREKPITRESIMVLNGAMEQEELMLMSVDGYETLQGADGSLLPVFIFGDDDDMEEDDDFDDDDDDFDDDEDDDYDDDDDDELDEDEDDFDDDDDDFDEDEDDVGYDEDDE